MYAITYIVLFAAACLLLLVMYDNRKAIINLFKKLLTPKPKTAKQAKKTKEEKQPQPETQPEKEVKQENISYGAFTTQAEIEDQQDQKQEELYKADTIFTPVATEDDSADFDIDQMLQEIEDERREEAARVYASDSLEPLQMPDFDSMSMTELNKILEEDMSSGTTASYGLPIRKRGLTGEDLGEYIKELPHEVKVLIAADIFKRKF